MSLFDIFKRTQPIIINQIMPDEKKGPEAIDKDIMKEPISRVRESLKDWSDAVISVENPYMPLGSKRYNLLNLYRNIALDPHLFALTETIHNRICQTPFQIMDESGEIDEEKHKLFERSWFTDFIKYCLEAEYYGFSLMQFSGLNENSFKEVQNVDRFYIRPEINGVSKRLYDDEAFIFYDQMPYSDWTLFVKSRTYLGRYNAVAKRFILKREIEQYWAVFNELHTTANLVVKTEINNAAHRADLIAMLENRKHSNFQLIGIDDEAFPLDTGGTGYISYKDFEQSCNQAMSKAFVGSTMVLDDGSSRSQAEVHEDNTSSFVQSFRVWIQDIINERLIPMMQAHNLGIKITDRFRWELSERLTSEQWSTIINATAVNFDLDEAEVSEKLGLTVTKKEIPEPLQPNNGQDIKKKLNNLYKIEN